MEMSRRNLIIIAAAVAILLAGAAGVRLFLIDDEEVPAEPVAVKSAHPLYQNIGTLVVNLVDDEGETHYMQVDVTVMTHSAKAAKTLEHYVPVLRNAFLEMFSTHTYKDMLVPVKREELRVKSRELVQHVAMKKMKQSQIDDVLFTSLVIQ